MATDIESSVDIPAELHAQKVALDNGEKPRVTVRQLLRWLDVSGMMREEDEEVAVTELGDRHVCF